VEIKESRGPEGDKDEGRKGEKRKSTNIGFEKMIFNRSKILFCRQMFFFYNEHVYSPER